MLPGRARGSAGRGVFAEETFQALVTRRMYMIPHGDATRISPVLSAPRVTLMNAWDVWRFVAVATRPCHFVPVILFLCILCPSHGSPGGKLMQRVSKPLTGLTNDWPNRRLWRIHKTLRPKNEDSEVSRNHPPRNKRKFIQTMPSGSSFHGSIFI